MGGCDLSFRSSAVRLRVFVTLALLIAGLAVLLDAPARAQEDRQTETFALDSFDAIHLRGSGNVTIETGSPPSIEVSADRRAMGFIEVSVEDGVLDAGFAASLVFDVAGFGSIDYLITTPSLSSLEVDGPLNVTIHGLTADALALDLSAAAKLEIHDLQASTLAARLDLASSARVAGTVDGQTVTLSNTSTWDAAELDSATASVTAETASEATVRVRESLTGSVSTVATLRYISEAAEVDVESSTLGSVEDLPFTPLPDAATPIPVATPNAEATPATAAAPMQVNVEIREFAFQPPVVEVAVGGSVTWTNHDRFPHDVAQLPAGSGFSSPQLGDGESFTQTFDTPGVIDYFCPLHPTMTGQVIVHE
jgi:plastocyanin